ncbi:hypothetical protein ES319_D06G154600v1 [Gossypium barbadense]|uniref:Uncharacterized protein n=2 Tax=Gossypium TaxID=3633 RepID=A0A5J5R237_GOSBA|nr:hypothetical protein ES319_D06G154600v1 [Gossypium barbadense]TYH67130.1 hypothetical protein ES332_D06G168000v1 [Gossypium tomentosum]
MMANKKAAFCWFMLMWLLARKLFGKHLKAKSANMLKTVEDLEVSRRYWSFYKIQPSPKYILGLKYKALFLHLEPSMLLETKDVELASLLVQSASS